VATGCCIVADLLLGSIPTPAYIDPVKFIVDTSEEIDVAFSPYYETPIILTLTAITKPTILFLKQVNAKLASGRILMASSAGHEDAQVNAYGKYLIDQAFASIYKVCEGDYVLPGVIQVAPVANDSGGVRIYNEDATSAVEDFYTRVTTPISESWYPNQVNWPYPYGG